MARDGSGLRGAVSGFQQGFGLVNDYQRQQKQMEMQEERLDLAKAQDERQAEQHELSQEMSKEKLDKLRNAQQRKKALRVAKSAEQLRQSGNKQEAAELLVRNQDVLNADIGMLTSPEGDKAIKTIENVLSQSERRDFEDPELANAVSNLFARAINKNPETVEKDGKQHKVRKKFVKGIYPSKSGKGVSLDLGVVLEDEDGNLTRYDAPATDGRSANDGGGVKDIPIENVYKNLQGAKVLKQNLDQDNELRNAIRSEIVRQGGELKDPKRPDLVTIYDKETGGKRKGYINREGQFVPVGGVKGQGQGGDPYGHLGEGIDAEKVTDFMEKRAARYFGERVGDKFAIGKNAEPVYNAFTRLGRQYVRQGQSLQEAADNAYADAVMANAPQAREQIRNQVMQNNNLTQADLEENPKAEQLVHQKVRERFHSQRDKFLKEAGIKQAGGRRRRAQQGSGQGGSGGAEWLDQYEVAGDPQKVRQYIAQKTKEAMENNQGMTQEKAMKWAAQSAALQGYLREKGQGGQKKQQSASQQKDQEPQVTHKGRGFEEDSWSPLMDAGRAIMGGLNTAAQGLSEKFDRTGELQKIVQDMEPGDSAPLVYQVVSKMYDPETGKWQPPEGEKWPSAQELKRAYPHLKGKALEVANQLLKKQGERRGLKGAQ